MPPWQQQLAVTRAATDHPFAEFNGDEYDARNRNTANQFSRR
jgi:hypothetical protein